MHGEARIDCHVKLGAQCAGVAIYRTNVCKSPRDPEIITLPADRDAVFGSAVEFREHHESGPLVEPDDESLDDDDEEDELR
jgi:hypothetical protein